jgi:hypothetical protein
LIACFYFVLAFCLTLLSSYALASDKDKKTTPVEIAVVLNDLAMFMKHHSNGAG